MKTSSKHYNGSHYNAQDAAIADDLKQRDIERRIADAQQRKLNGEFGLVEQLHAMTDQIKILIAENKLDEAKAIREHARQLVQAEDERIAQTTTTAEQLAAGADAAVVAFVKFANTEYNSLADQIANTLAGLHVLARNAGIDWKTVVENGTILYKVARAEQAAAKPKAAKAGKPFAIGEAGATFEMTVVLPDGAVAHVVRGKPYGYAAAIRKEGGVWEVYAWVSSKETASKRIGDAKRAGIEVADKAVIETTINGQQPEVDQPEPSVVVEQPATTAMDWPRVEPLPEITRQTEVEEPIHVKILGLTAVHYSDDGDDTYCGCGSDRSYMQVEDDVTCKNCQKVAVARTAKTAK